MSLTFRFVAGKGGVGKTTLAAARAVAEAGRGGKVLVVSTDPAHSLGDALRTSLTNEPQPVPVGGLGELLAAELAAGPAWERWLGPRREAFRTLAERGSLLDSEDVARLLALPVPGVDELVGLLELVRLAEATGCSRVVVDTAPTAHTLRLLRMPEALGRLGDVLAALGARHREVAEALTGRTGGWPPDEADAVAEEVAAQARALGELIRDPDRAAFTWVLLPEALSLAESRDALSELETAGAAVDELVVNRVTPPPPDPCRACRDRRRAEAAVVEEVREAWPDRPVVLVPELEEEPRGPEALREVAGHLEGGWDPDREERAEEVEGVEAGPPALPAAPPPWLPDLVPPGLRLLLFGGKGGVGKTTCAAAAALLAARAEPRRPVLLLSTDPAHSLGDALEVPLDDQPRTLPGAPDTLRARELDAAAVFARWQEGHREALDRAFDRLGGSGGRSGLDAPLDRAVLKRLLEATPPGLDELVALSELLDSLAEERDGRTAAGTAMRQHRGRAVVAAETLVVVDTAPTGHALRLLEMPDLALEWDHALLELLLKYREAVGLPAGWAEELLELARRLKAFRALLADPARCRFAAVTRAGELPRRETERLLEALGRLGVAAPTFVVNAFPEGECARCRRAAGRARDELERLPASSILTAPARYPPPRGVPTLERWGRSWRLE